MGRWRQFLEFWANNFRHGAVNKPASETWYRVEDTYMKIGDKVVAVGSGVRTKDLNNGDIHRSHGRGGFDSLVAEGVSMTVQSIDGYVVKTKYYTFDISDLRLVQSVESGNDVAVETPRIQIERGLYTRAEVESLLAEFN